MAGLECAKMVLLTSLATLPTTTDRSSLWYLPASNSVVGMLGMNELSKTGPNPGAEP